MNKRVKKIIAVGLTVAACLGLTACAGNVRKFDAAGYVEATLDAKYKDKFDKYAEFCNATEEEAKESVYKGYEDNIRAIFDGFEISDAAFSEFLEQCKQFDQLAKYEVKDAEKKKNGDYEVEVVTSQANVQELLDTYVGEQAETMGAQGVDFNEPDVVANIYIDAAKRAIADNSYADEQTIIVKVTLNDEKQYEILPDELDKVDNALFAY